MYYKIINKLTIIDPFSFFKFNTNPFNTRGHSLKLSKQLFHNNNLANNLANRHVDCWNALPSDIVNANSLRQFKNLLNKFELIPSCMGSC